MITDREIKAYRCALAAVEKARDASNAYRGAFDDVEGRRLRLAVALAEVELHDAALALDAADHAVAELDEIARSAARAFAAAQVSASVPALKSYAAKAVAEHATAIAATLTKATEREAAEQRWFATWSAVRTAIELHMAERRAQNLPPARWYVPAAPDWRELLGPRPAPPKSPSLKIAADLRREGDPPSEFTERRTRGAFAGDLEDMRERAV